MAGRDADAGGLTAKSNLDRRKDTMNRVKKLGLSLGRRVRLPKPVKKQEDTKEDRERRILLYQQRVAAGLCLFDSK